MIKRIITEISEEDFRKLDLKVSRNKRVDVKDNRHDYHTFKMVEQPVNDLLDEGIEYLLQSGYEMDLEALKLPVTIAIHEPGGYYLDKFMNRYTGSQTFQMGWGIKHLYSTRDYYEDHDDYWRVRKDETKVIYRVYLNEKWQKQFKLKHKTSIVKVIEPNKHWIEEETYYNELTGEWERRYLTEIQKNGAMTSVKPYNDNDKDKGC